MMLTAVVLAALCALAHAAPADVAEDADPNAVFLVPDPSAPTNEADCLAAGDQYRWGVA